MDGSRCLGKCLAFLATAMLLPSSMGCIGFAAQMLYFWKGETVPAAFSDLEGKRVAVVCVSDDSAFGPGAIPTLVAQQIEIILGQEVPNIDLVGQDEVADWIDHNDWDQVDYRDIGRGVKAAMVVAVDLDSLRLHEGQTLYKGRVNVKVKVYDMTEGGKPVYTNGSRQFIFPEHTAVHSADMEESQFSRIFIRVLAQHIARQFYDYQMKDAFGKDATLMGG